VQVPLALLGNDETPGFNRELRKDVVFWGAFAIPVVLRALQGLHHHFPSVPMVPIGDLGNVGLMFQDPVWADLFNTTSLQIHLALVGIAILMRSEVSASFWVFEWFYLGVGAFLYSMGPGEGAFAYTPQATFGYVMFIYYCRLGGTLVAATLLLWTARPYITRGWRLLIRGVSERRDGDGLLMWSVPLIVVGIAMYLGWAHAGGMTMGAALLMLIVYVASLVVLARIIADGGLFWASLSLDPMRTTVRFLGTEAMSGETLTMVAFTNHVPMAPRSNILPSIMDSFQFGNKTGVSPNKIVAGMAVGILSVGIFSLATLLWLSYSHGATNLDVGVILSSATFPFAEAGTYMRNAASVNVASIWTTVLGGVLMSIFIFLHRRLLWWPVYPFGFAIAESATMEHMWLSVFIGWFVHVIVVRIWGTAGYRRIKPAAIGVVVGDFLSLGLWAVIDIMTGTIGNRLSHGVSTW